MAQSKYYKPYGALEVKATEEYTAVNIPATANIVELQRGVRIQDEKGEETKLRGVRVSINPIGITAAIEPLPNVPFIWIEGTFLIFDANFTYTFLDNGVVGYGIEITP